MLLEFYQKKSASIIEALEIYIDALSGIVSTLYTSFFITLDF